MGYNDGITIIFPAFPTCACPSLQSKPSVQGLQPHRVHSTSVTQDLLQLAISPAQFNAAVDAVAQQLGEAWSVGIGCWGAPSGPTAPSFQAHQVIFVRRSTSQHACKIGPLRTYTHTHSIECVVHNYLPTYMPTST